MGIQNIQLGQAGLVDVLPRLVYLYTNDSNAVMMQTGYLNHAVAEGFQFQPTDMAAVIQQASSVAPQTVTWCQVIHSGNNWSLNALNKAVRFAAKYTTVGGAAAEQIAMPGVIAADLPFIQVIDNGTNNVTVLQAACTANLLTITFSGDPGADTIIAYQVMRVA